MAEGSTLEVAVVSAERLLWQGEAKSVVAKTPEGEIGILPGHEPVLALLLDSPLRIEESDGNKMMVAVHGDHHLVAVGLLDAERTVQQQRQHRLVAGQDSDLTLRCLRDDRLRLALPQQALG